MRTTVAAAILVVAGMPASGHRLDEYLQGTLLAVGKNRVQVEMTLTPGVAVFPVLISDIDSDGNGKISEDEKLAYAREVLHDLSFGIDGRRLTPQLRSLRFPTTAEMKEGRGEIRLAFDADVPAGGRHRKITLENRHQSRISAYQVNCLVPSDPAIHISKQDRNYSQSQYGVEYEQTDVRPNSPFFALLTSRFGWLGGIGLFLSMRLTYLLRRRSRPVNLPLHSLQEVKITGEAQ